MSPRWTGRRHWCITTMWNSKLWGWVIVSNWLINSIKNNDLILIYHNNPTLFKSKLYHTWSRGGEMSGVEPTETERNFPSRPLSIMSGDIIYQQRSETYNRAPRNTPRPQFHISLTQTLSTEVVRWNVWLSDEYHSTPSSCRGRLPFIPIWNYEWWLKLWLIGLVIPVYILFIP